MSTNLKSAIAHYLRSGSPSRSTRDGYLVTARKWEEWGEGVPIELLGRRQIRDFLDWVYERAVVDGGTNPGRTANKAREQLRALLGWAWDQELLDAIPRFPKPRAQRDVAGRHYLTKSEINALYFATHSMRRPKGWREIMPVGRYWRCALVLFFNYGLDTGTVWKYTRFHEPILWRHVSGERRMNRVVHAHIKSIMPNQTAPNDPVFHGGGSRPNTRFQLLCDLAAISPKTSVETDEEKPWLVKDLRKTCATYYDRHVPESSIEILGHAVGGITYRHYAHRAPLAHRAIMTLPQPSAFSSLLRGDDGQCPCCQRRFAEAT